MYHSFSRYTDLNISSLPWWYCIDSLMLFVLKWAGSFISTLQGANPFNFFPENHNVIRNVTALFHSLSAPLNLCISTCAEYSAVIKLRKQTHNIFMCSQITFDFFFFCIIRTRLKVCMKMELLSNCGSGLTSYMVQVFIFIYFFFFTTHSI